MNANVKFLAMAAVSMLAMTACESDDVLTSGEKGMSQVNFEMGVSPVTRTVTADNSYETTFKAGDKVGIFVNNQANVEYTASGEGTLTWGGYCCQG